MSTRNETVKCDRRTCQHVHLESERVWVRDPKQARSITTCPSCGHGVWVILNPIDGDTDRSALSPRLIGRIHALRLEIASLKHEVPIALGGPRSFVRVDCSQFKGIGVFLMVSENDPTRVDVLLGNGNVWSYPADCCRRAKCGDAGTELRLLWLRRRGIKCSGSTHRKTLRGRLP